MGSEGDVIVVVIDRKMLHARNEAEERSSQLRHGIDKKSTKIPPSSSLQFKI